MTQPAHYLVARYLHLKHVDSECTATACGLNRFQSHARQKFRPLTPDLRLPWNSEVYHGDTFRHCAARRVARSQEVYHTNLHLTKRNSILMQTGAVALLAAKYGMIACVFQRW